MSQRRRMRAPRRACVLVMAKRVGAAAVETGEEGGRDQDDLQPECSKKRKLAYSGAAKYQSKFKSEWCKSYPIRAVPNDHHSFLICLWLQQIIWGLCLK